MLEFEEPRGAATPLVPSQPLFLFCLNYGSQLWLDNFLESVSGDGYVVAVPVHLDQLEILSVNTLVKKVIVELQHPQL